VLTRRTLLSAVVLLAAAKVKPGKPRRIVAPVLTVTAT